MFCKQIQKLKLQVFLMKIMTVHPFSTEAAIAPPEELKKCPVDNTFKIIGKKFTVFDPAEHDIHKAKTFQ